MVTMERPVRPSLRLWVPGSDKDADDRVRQYTGRVKFLLGHRQCCLAAGYKAGSCKGDRYEGDAHRYTNFRPGAAFEHVSVELASLDAAFEQLPTRLKRGAECLIRRGAAHIAPDGKFIPGVFAVISWGRLARFYHTRKQDVMDDANDAAEAMALQMLDWIKVDLPEPTPAA